MKKVFFVLIFFLVCFCFPTEVVLSEKNNHDSLLPISPEEIIDKVFEAGSSIKTLKYIFICNERVEGRLSNMRSKVKLQTSPRRLYLKCKEAEVLWSEENSDNLALVHPYGFPYVNINLDPNSSFLRRGQHHTIHEAGFEYFINIIKANALVEKAKRLCVYNGEEKINNRICFKLTVLNLDFTFVDYKVQKDENMISIARKLNVSEYMILENNPNFSSYTSIDDGDIIKVPNAYSKTTILYIDEQYYLPISSRVYDNKGLFECYDYDSLQINPVIKTEEFTRKFKEYDF